MTDDPPRRPHLDPDPDRRLSPTLLQGDLHRMVLAVEENAAHETPVLWYLRAELAGRRLLAWAGGSLEGAALRLAVVDDLKVWFALGFSVV